MVHEMIAGDYSPSMQVIGTNSNVQVIITGDVSKTIIRDQGQDQDPRTATLNGTIRVNRENAK